MTLKTESKFGTRATKRTGMMVAVLSLVVLISLFSFGSVAHSQTFKVGSFNKISTVTTQNVAHGLGETPKALILWTNGKTDENFGASFLFAFGITDQSRASYSVAIASNDGVTTPDSSRRLAAKAITIVQWGQSLVAEADVSAWDSTNFTLNWTSNTASTGYVIHFLAISGSYVSSKVVNWTMGTATGNKAVTGVGFVSNLVLHAHLGYDFTSAAGNSATNAHLGLGVMDAAGNQWATTVFSLDRTSVGNSDTQRGQQTDGCIYSFDNGLTVQKKASFVSMDSDGFTVNFTNATSNSASQVISLALTDLNVKAGNFSKNTTTAPPTQSQSVTGVGFQPKALLLASFQTSAQASPLTQTRFGLGASDGTTQGSSAFADQDNVATSNVDGIDKTSKAFMVVNNNTPAIGAEADLASMDSGGFTLSWTTNNTTATEILYLAFGSDCSFKYRKQLTIDYTKVACSSGVTEFPVLISMSGVTELKTTSYTGGHVQSSSGYDIIFRASNGVDQLYHEIESYSGSAGTLAAWVRVPTVSGTADTTIYMYFGNQCITSAPPSTFTTEVWDDNYMGVWHLKESSGNFADSTSNGNTGTDLVSATGKTGKIGSGQQFDGTNDYISAPYMVNPSTTDFT